jgi:hypothetical protein
MRHGQPPGRHSRIVICLLSLFGSPIRVSVAASRCLITVLRAARICR